MQRQQHQKSNSKWWLIALVVILVAVGGYFVGKAMNGGSENGSTASNASSSTSSAKRSVSEDAASSDSISGRHTSMMSRHSGMMSDRSSMMNDDRSSGKNNDTTTAVGPYSVSTESMNAIGSFQYRGVNVPASLDLSFNNQSGAGTATFTWRGPDGSQPAVYNVMYEEIPTTPIRVFGASNNAVRTVKVNTRIHIEGLKSGDSSEIDTAGDLYAFKNRDGGISIATPNYAGNVEPDEYDVMQEIVHR
ncbi:MAG: hypothetical protein LKG79_08280 [Furfurilactobacillus sp.]|jgi:hypothetical protein|uniref:Uncharacterized protein n=1 Tax=Furfurilactobacillus milii TaxID=2888272 RepID=A0ABT6D8S2_9LACO|nr:MULTISPECIES: hypothetical protein [Furfurilactobacillus]QLE65867.1 lipoprotein [Furfurilactobacillus rossiae]MCF6160225.1 hypothetical protein [Furfurilactobacillus milii]MCF6162168.1 hypothetical protein [Furfurilactobacillus milii]MCF6420400.1 hypothetical protein [Furfurilactobacillus milii]MCH4012389.1 hypothetical protein [Furfurilactobacillus sp.]